MKAIYLLASLLFFTVSITAQTNFLNRPVAPASEKNYLINKNKRLITSPGIAEYTIIKLPHHNMPCLVPDISLVAAMPTCKTVLLNQYIPNPYFNYTAAATKENITSLPK